MELGLMIFAVVMAVVAGGVALVCAFTEVNEAIDVHRLGWARGHHQHHLPHRTG